MNKNKSNKLFSFLSVILVIVGILILLYPLISNQLYKYNSQKLMEHYESNSAEKTPDEIKADFTECNNYNYGLFEGAVLLTDPFEQGQLDPFAHPYVDLLNENGDGSMGVLSIPKINLKLIIYHGTSENILQKGVGHLQGSSLPVGGESTHAVLSGHTGLPTKELFTNLNQVKIGDVFFITVLGTKLSYKVDQILTVLPSQTDQIRIEKNKDYVTLVTCTPYGVNSHRLLVRGSRIPNQEAEQAVKDIKSNFYLSNWMKEYIKAIIFGLLSLLLCILILFVFKKIKRKKKSVSTREKE